MKEREKRKEKEAKRKENKRKNKLVTYKEHKLLATHSPFLGEAYGCKIIKLNATY